MADQEYSWIPPKYRVDDNGRMQFETAFPLNDYKSKWTDDERKRVESEGVYAFRGVVDRDRANFAKLQSGVQPIDDSDLWLWVNDRGLVPELDVMGMLGEFAVGAVKAGGRLAADYITPKRLYDQVTDLKGTTKQDMARLLASAEVGIQDYRMLASGARRLADMVTNFETRTEKLEANRLFLKQASELQARVDANIKTVAEQFGVDPEKLSMEAEVLSEILDPFNLVPGGLALKAGAKVAAKAGFKSTAGLVGLADDMGRELAEAYAERAVLEVAEKSTEAINQTIATLEKNLAEANTELAAKVSGAGLGRKVTGAGLAVAGAGVEKTGKGLERLQDLGSHMLDKISEGDSATRKAIGALATPATGAAIGGLVGGKEGAVAGGVLGAAPQVLTHAGRDAKIIGKLWEVGETGLPITRAIRLNAEVSGLTKAVAKALDPFSAIIRPTAKGIAGAARGAATGGVIGAVYGYVASGGGVQPGGIAQGAAFGGTLGAMAGFAGVWHPLAKQGEDIRIRESQRKVVEDRFVPNSPSRLAWDKLDRGAQTAVASHLHAFPDLRLALINDQDGGFVNGTLFINPNKPESAIRSVVAHEIMHDMQARGYRKAIERIYIGNVAEGRPGLFTKLDENGKPVVSEERTSDGQQKYETVDEFKGWKTRYENLVLQADKDRLTYSITDSDLAMELAAEQGVDFLMSQEYKDTLKPTLTSLGEGFYRSVLGRMGVTFDENGPVKGTQLFQQQVSKSPEMQSLLRGYAKAQAKSKGSIGYTDQDRVGTAVTRAQIRKNPELLKSLLGSDSINVDPATGLPEGIVLDGNGKWLIKDETKIYASPRTIRQKQREMAEAIRAQLDTLSDLDPDFVQRRDTEDGRTGYYGRILPDAVLDALEAQGKWNPHQLAHMREINEALKRSDGTPFMHFYQSAQNRPIGGQKARHGAFAGAWHNEIPYGWMFDQNNNLLLTMLDPDTLVSNLDRAWLKNRADVKSTWSGNREQMVADAFKYLDNVSAGRPGETDIGVQKRDKINALLGLKGNRRGDANPFYSQLQPSAQSTIVRRRLDRINRASPTSGRKIAWGYKQYEQTKANFRPNSEVDSVSGNSEGRDMTQETMLGSRPMFFLDQDILDTLPPDHFQHEKSRWGVVRDPQDYYAHGTLRENAASIAENGIEARVGDFVKEAYGDSGMRLHKKVFMSPYSSKARDFSRPYETAINAMERYIAVKLGKAQSDVTEADFRAHGAIALVPKKEVAQALGAKTRSTGAAEPSDIVIGDTGAGLPAEWVLTGDSLIRWMNDPSQVSSPDIRYRPAVLVHYSNIQGLTKTDPKKHGTGLSGAERQRKKDYPELYLDRTYFGREGYEKEQGLGPNKYEATVEMDELYDFGADPEDLYSEADDFVQNSEDYAPFDDNAKITKMEQLVRDRGYRGYYVDDVVALFDKQEVRPGGVRYLPARAEVEALTEFDDPASIRAAVAKSGWIAIEGTPQGKEHDSPEGIQGTNDLRAWLADSGLEYKEIEGRYGSKAGPAFLVNGVPASEIPQWAQRWDQESVAYNKGLMYQDGSVTPAKALLVGDKAKSQEFWSALPSGTAFSLDLDFKTRIPPEQASKTYFRPASDASTMEVTKNPVGGMNNLSQPKTHLSLPKNVLDTNPASFFETLDGAKTRLMDDPARFGDPKGYAEYMREAGVWGDIMTAPPMVKVITETPQKYVELLTGGFHQEKTVPGTRRAAAAGLDSTVRMRQAISGRPPEMITALHHLWGVLSRMLPPLQQESMWLRLVSTPEVLTQIQASIDGNYALDSKDWVAVVQRSRAATEAQSNKMGNQGAANANAFHLMLKNWNGRWSDVSNVYAADNATDMGRRFWALGAGKAGIKNKVQRFIGLTFGVPGVIMDRWQYVQFFGLDVLKTAGAAEFADYFRYSKTGTPEDPSGIYGVYGGIESANPVLSLAFYEGMEAVLNQAITNSPELRSYLGNHAHVGGLHWHGWSSIKNEAVGHSSLDLTYDLAVGYPGGIGPEQVLDAIAKGVYYTEGLNGNTTQRFTLERGKVVTGTGEPVAK